MTETTETKKTTRKPNPLTAILNEVKAKADDGGVLPLVGGANGEGAQEYHAAQEHRWSIVNQHREKIGKLGSDGLLLEDVHAAGAATSKLDQREALILVAAQAVAAVAALDGA
ncbi:hypothetical protein [Streptomyces phage Vanseggelen]|uniref:Uncharacterized protein n=1 Tax=Streptomyces phage Vanseggelen TaxID=3065246 RepID=A0AA50F1T7_9CAUD|nr:hypothetical protein [Streptomyces phage Vanseggelen]